MQQIEYSKTDKLLSIDLQKSMDMIFGVIILLLGNLEINHQDRFVNQSDTEIGSQRGWKESTQKNNQH